jgi:hypothetical protein
VGKASAQHACTAPRPSMAELLQTQKKVPFIYAPAASTASTSERGPWEGHRYALSFGSLGGSESSLAAAALDAGMLATQEPTLARPEGVDPHDLPWAHVIVARLSLDFSSQAEKGGGKQFDTAAATLRAVHVIAVQRPWCAVFDFAPSFRAAQAGAPWRLFEGMLCELGYVADAFEVCPSACLDCSWVGSLAPSHGCRGT